MSSLNLKRTIAAGAVALVIGGAALGVARAQQPSVTTGPSNAPASGPSGPSGFEAHHQQFLDTLASKLGVTTDRLKQAITDARHDLGLPDHPAGPMGGDHHGGMFFGPMLGTAAQAMNISVDQLRQELPGKSLADVARAHNVDPTTVADALKKQASERIDHGVSAGWITADRAAQIKQSISDRIDQLMTRTFPAGGPAGSPPAGGWGPRGDRSMDMHGPGGPRPGQGPGGGPRF